MALETSSALKSKITNMKGEGGGVGGGGRWGEEEEKTKKKIAVFDY